MGNVPPVWATDVRLSRASVTGPAEGAVSIPIGRWRMTGSSPDEIDYSRDRWFQLHHFRPLSPVSVSAALFGPAHLWDAVHQSTESPITIPVWLHAFGVVEIAIKHVSVQWGSEEVPEEIPDFSIDGRIVEDKQQRIQVYVHSDKEDGTFAFVDAQLVHREMAPLGRIGCVYRDGYRGFADLPHE